MTELIQNIDAAEFLRQLNELSGLYGELLALTRLQCESADAYGSMSGLLERKQVMMRKIDAVGLDFTALRERWVEAREALSEEQRADAGEKIKVLQNTLRELVAMENRWHDKVATRKEETLDQIRKLQGGRKIARAYGRPQSEADTRFLDKTE
jgi:hypothetical protein